MYRLSEHSLAIETGRHRQTETHFILHYKKIKKWKKSSAEVCPNVINLSNDQNLIRGEEGRCVTLKAPFIRDKLRAKKS